MTHRSFLPALLAMAVLAGHARDAAAFDPPLFTSMWGSRGTAPGQFMDVAGLACASDGSVYVVDSNNSRVQKFDPFGGFLLEWGSEGDGPGQFIQPSHVVLDASGFVYVSDHGSDRVQKFTSGGTFVTQWGGLGAGNGQLDWPWGLAVGPTGDIYVCDFDNRRIQVFSNAGAYKSQWSTDLGQGFSPYAVAISSTGHVFVLLYKNQNGWINKLAEFTSTGTFVSQWNPPSLAETVVIDALDRLFIPDGATARVWVYSTAGIVLGSWGSSGSGSGQFTYPTGIAFRGSAVYVSDFGEDRVQRFDYGSSVPIQPDLVSNIWDWTDHTLHLVLHYDNPSTLSESLPLSGSVYPQPYGAFIFGLPTSVADFFVPPLSPGTEFDVFVDVPRELLPPSAPLFLAGGGPVVGGPCAPPGWAGGVDLVWNEGAISSHSAWQSGEVLVGPGAGYSYIGVTSGSTSPIGCAWGFVDVCPGFTATLFETDRVTPAPDLLPPGWNGVVGVTADAGVPSGAECCMNLVLRQDRVPETVEVCARTCPWSTVGVTSQLSAPGILGVTPNPASRATTVHFAVAGDERATLEVLDVAGRRVATLWDGELSPGVHAQSWDGSSANGGRLPAGTYFLRLRAGDTISRSTVILTR